MPTSSDRKSASPRQRIKKERDDLKVQPQPPPQELYETPLLTASLTVSTTSSAAVVAVAASEEVAEANDADAETEAAASKSPAT